MRRKTRTQRIDEALAILDDRVDGPLPEEETVHQLCGMVPTISKETARKALHTWQLQLGRTCKRM